MLVIGEDGFGERFSTAELKSKGRGTMGVKVGEGPLAAALVGGCAIPTN